MGLRAVRASANLTQAFNLTRNASAASTAVTRRILSDSVIRIGGASSTFGGEVDISAVANLSSCCGNINLYQRPCNDSQPATLILYLYWSHLAINNLRKRPHLAGRMNSRHQKTAQRLVTAPLSQNQWDALMSFTYNLGAANLESSTLRRLLNAGNYAAAAEQFARWNKAGGQVLAGLVRRRAAERDLFLGAA